MSTAEAVNMEVKLSGPTAALCLKPLVAVRILLRIFTRA